LASIVWTYDGNGNPIRVEEGYSGPSGTRATVRVWDDLDRLASVTDPEGRTLSYLYDANGNRTRLTDPDGKVTLYAFDGLNRPTSVAIAGAGVTTYSYFKDSQLKRVDFPNATRAAYTYDAAGRVESIANTLGAATISRYDYGYDANGNRVEQIEENGGAPETTTYAYDDADRLTEVAYPDRTATYAYDNVGNRIGEQAVDPGGALLVDRTLANNERNQLTTITDHLDPQASVTYTWDANGNQTAKTVDTTTTAFTFDLRDRLVQITQGAALLGRYAYDHQDLRTSKETPTETLRTLYDDQSVLLQTDAATGATLAKYDYGPDRLLSLDGTTHGRQYYLHDALGSIVDLTRPDGTLAARYQWDAWGNLRSTSGASENPFGFTGHERDEGTGLYYARARFYDAEVGRFLSEDPFEGEAETPPSLHRYLYAYGNPTVFVDPTGEVVVTPRAHLEEQENLERLERELAAAQVRSDELREEAFSVDEEELRRAFLEPIRLRHEIERSHVRVQEGADFLQRAWVVVERAETPDAQRMALIDLFKAEAGGMEYSVAVRLLGEFLDPLPCRDANCQMVQDIGKHASAVNALAAVVENVVYLAAGEMLLAGRAGAAARGAAPRGGSLSAVEANAPHVAASRRPPYAAGTRARDIVLQQPREFVRVHGEGNQGRSWLMRREEIEGLTAAEIRDRFALPELPSYVSDVHVPAGARLRVGTAAEQAGWGHGGATQYELLDRLPESAFTNQRPLP
jgi:RHS repeat-associated protein